MKQTRALIGLAAAIVASDLAQLAAGPLPIGRWLGVSGGAAIYLAVIGGLLRGGQAARIARTVAMAMPLFPLGALLLGVLGWPIITLDPLFFGVAGMQVGAAVVAYRSPPQPGG